MVHPLLLTPNVPRSCADVLFFCDRRKKEFQDMNTVHPFLYSCPSILVLIIWICGMYSRKNRYPT